MENFDISETIIPVLLLSNFHGNLCVRLVAYIYFTKNDSVKYVSVYLYQVK